MDLTGKGALVTGAGGGIGRASAIALAREGARVVATDRDGDSGRDTVDRIRASGGSAWFVGADIAHPDEVDRLTLEAADLLGRIDVAHINAGVTQLLAPLTDIATPAWDRMLATNLTGTFFCLRAQIAHMVATGGGGAIVATSSALSLLGFPMTAAYSVSKAGINQLVRSAAAEYGKDGIRVNAVLPGPIETAMMADVVADPAARANVERSLPLGRLGTPEDIAEAVVWLCSDRSGFVTGATLVADGGQVLL